MRNPKTDKYQKSKKRRIQNKETRITDEISDKRAIDSLNALQRILVKSGKETIVDYIKNTCNQILNLASKDVRGFVIGNINGVYQLVSVKNIDTQLTNNTTFSEEELQYCLLLNLKKQNGVYKFHTDNLLTGFSKPAADFIKNMGVYNDLTVLCVPVFSQNQLLALVVLLTQGKKAMPPFKTEIAKLLAGMIGEQFSLKNLSYERDSLLNTIEALALAIEEKDLETKGHSQRVQNISMQLAHKMNLFSHEVEEIGLAGLLHDVGKIGIKESILGKTEPLSNEEFEEIKLHPIKTKKILEPLAAVKSGNFIDISYLHHEKFDGSGYPEGRKGDEIPIGAKILAIADSYDAMVSPRIYKSARTKKEALNEILKCKGSHFDPNVVDAFFEIAHEISE